MPITTVRSSARSSSVVARLWIRRACTCRIVTGSLSAVSASIRSSPSNWLAIAVASGGRVVLWNNWLMTPSMSVRSAREQVAFSTSAPWSVTHSAKRCSNIALPLPIGPLIITTLPDPLSDSVYRALSVSNSFRHTAHCCPIATFLRPRPRFRCR